MFLVDNRYANRDWDRVLSHVKEIIGKHGGEMIKCEKWGERKLAYPINGHKRGTYLLTYFRASGDAPNRIYRDVELSDTFLRAMILAIEREPTEEEMTALREGASDERPSRSARWSEGDRGRSSGAEGRARRSGTAETS